MVRRSGAIMNEVISNPLWLQAFQKKQLEKFLLRGYPTKKEEHWKYTTVAPVEWKEIRSGGHAALCPPYDAVKLVFINGVFSEELSNLDDTIFVAPLSQAIDKYDLKSTLTHEFDIQRYPFAAMNNAYMTDGVFLKIPKNNSVTKPIHILFMNTMPTAVRNIFLIEENAEVSIVEEYTSAENSFTNALTEIHLENNARVRFHKIQEEHLSATHVANIFIQQQQDSCAELFFLSKGAKLEREDVHINLSARGAECHLLGLYALMHDNQHVDHHLAVEHLAEQGTSSMLYKGILDKKSRAVFNGKVYVHPHAQHTHSYQANHNVLLSKDAEINTKPELEIYADDVKCTHGATVGQVDTEALFYLCSRGIDKDTALRILLEAFADEVLSKISHKQIREYIQQRAGHYVEL
jgi:Fe-S cluster assembly protein SufD